MTHEVLTQPPPLENYNAYATDPQSRRIVDNLIGAVTNKDAINDRELGDLMAGRDNPRFDGMSANARADLVHTIGKAIDIQTKGMNIVQSQAPAQEQSAARAR